jgi:hypothetical protein
LIVNRRFAGATVNSICSPDNEERELTEFLNSVIHNVRKILESDPEISAAGIETTVMKLAQMFVGEGPAFSAIQRSYADDVRLFGMRNRLTWPTIIATGSIAQ